MKEKIVYATLELACEKGLAGVTMSQIAQRVGLKKSSLYSHFSSKKDIIVEMYELLRNRAKVKNGSEETDYERFVENKSLKEILQGVVMSYKKMNSVPRFDSTDCIPSLPSIAVREAKTAERAANSSQLLP